MPTVCTYWSTTKGEGQKQERIKVSPKSAAVLERHKTKLEAGGQRRDKEAEQQEKKRIEKGREN